MSKNFPGWNFKKGANYIMYQDYQFIIWINKKIFKIIYLGGFVDTSYLNITNSEKLYNLLDQIISNINKN